MRVGFAGTPEFAARALTAISDAGFTIPVCLTQPDRPKGRGLRVDPSPVKAIAERNGIEVLQPASLRDFERQASLRTIPLDVLVVAAYGLILPRAVLDWPRHGCLNIHASRLPRWRGAAPIQRAIEAGDSLTGITIMQMDAGLDTGPIVDRIDVPIDARETGGSLHDKLAAVGARAIVATLRRLAQSGALSSTPQPAEGATYAAKIERGETTIDWSQTAAVLERRIRAFDPTPGMAASFEGNDVKLWSVERVARGPGDATPGTVIRIAAAGIDVACGGKDTGDALRILELQPSGGRRMDAFAFASGHRVACGMTFGRRSA